MHAPTDEGDKSCLLAVGYWQPATGFTRVLDRILTPLADRYTIHLIGIGYKGPVQMGPITVHPCNLRGGDVFGIAQAATFIERHHPRVVFLLNDFWIASKYPHLLARYRAHTPIVCYCPLDGRIVDESLLAPLADIDRLVLYTEFARQEVTATAERLRVAGSITTFPQVSVIGHGVDTTAFHPLAGTIEQQLAAGGRVDVKRRLFPDLPDPDASFIVLNANRAQPRKRIDLTLAAFARFAAGKPANVRLVLHHAATPADERAEILRQAATLGIADRVTVGPEDGQPPDDTALNTLYNACDVGVNTAMGEGWGLVSFEHGATGAAQIVPRHSACAELWADAAAFVEPVETAVPAFSPLAMATVSAEGVATALERCYREPIYRRVLSRAAYHHARRPAYHWGTIAADWARLFAETQTGEAVR